MHVEVELKWKKMCVHINFIKCKKYTVLLYVCLGAVKIHNVISMAHSDASFEIVFCKVVL